MTDAGRALTVELSTQGRALVARYATYELRTDERRLLLGGAEGSGLELFDKDVCQHLPGLSFNNYGHMAQTPHAFVMSTADDRYNDQTALYVYWID